MKTVLTVAGSDSGGGAGIQADLRTFAAHGVHGLSAVTAVTAQNTTGVTLVHPVPPEVVVAQIEAVAADIRIDAVKTGMLSSAEVVEAVATSLARLRVAFLVVDPVLRASTGRALLADDALEALRRRLLPLAYCVTPNLEEAARLSGVPIRSDPDAREAARRIADLGPRTVVVTGGHRPTEEIVDLVLDGGTFVELRHPRVRASTTHGTGCTYSAALAAGLAQTRTLEDAARDAADFVAASIRRGVPLGAGPGPVRQV